MSGTTAQPQTGPQAAPHRASVELLGGEELAIGLVAVPVTSLVVQASKAPALVKTPVDVGGGRKLPRLQLEVAFSGRGTHLPPSLSCNVLCDIEATVMGVTRRHTYDAGAFTLKKEGERYALSATVDVVAAAMLGRGRASFSLAPVFPHAPIVDANTAYDFDLPVDLLLDGVKGSGGGGALSALIGESSEVTPRIAKALAELEGFALKATIVEQAGEVTKGKAGAAPRRESRREDQLENTIEVFAWREGLKARTWVVGTARQDASRFLTCFKPKEEGDYELDVRLAVSFDGGHTFAPLWTLEELGRTFSVRRPSLALFKTSVQPMTFFSRAVGTARQWSLLPRGVDREVFVEGRIDGFSPDVGALRWNLTVTLWGARPLIAEGSASPVSAPAPAPGQRPGPGPRPAAKEKPKEVPKERPRLAAEVVATRLVPLRDSGRFELLLGLDQLSVAEWASKAAYPLYFATFSFDRQVTNTPEPRPITEVMSVDPLRFHLATEQDLFDGATAAKAEAVCSEGLPGEPVRVPHVGAVRFGIEGEALAVRVHLAGDPGVWRKAKLSYALVVQGADASGQAPVEIPLDGKAPADAPHVRLASIDMADPRILGKTVRAVVRVESPAAQAVSEPLRCVPELLGPIEYTTAEDGSVRFVCGTHYVPTHLSKKVTTEQRLRFSFSEELLDGRRVPMGYIRAQHELPSGSAGLCAPSGLFGARLSDTALLDEAMKKGRVLLTAESASTDGRVLHALSAPLSLALKGSARPRSIKTPLRFGKCLSAAFKKRALTVAGDLTTPACADVASVAEYLLVIMACETGGSFTSSAENGDSHALGLIQFIVNGDEKIREIGNHPAGSPLDVVKRLEAEGATTPALRAERFRAELRSMPPELQLDNVRNFLARRVRASEAPRTLEDYYCCVFFPAAVGKPDDFVIGLPGSPAATQNPSLCVGGTLLKRSACQRIRDWWKRGEQYLADEDDDRPVRYKG